MCYLPGHLPGCSKKGVQKAAVGGPPGQARSIPPCHRPESRKAGRRVGRVRAETSARKRLVSNRGRKERKKIPIRRKNKQNKKNPDIERYRERTRELENKRTRGQISFQIWTERNTAAAAAAGAEAAAQSIQENSELCLFVCLFVCFFPYFKVMSE